MKKQTSRLNGMGLSALLLLVGSAFASAQTTIFVSPRGSDRYDGLSRTVNARERTGPFRNLEKAQATIRAMKQAGRLSPNGAQVIILDGTYNLRGSLDLKVEDSGTATAPIIWKADNPGKAIIDGGRILTTWRKVPTSMQSFLKPEARDKVVRASLRSLRIKNFRLAKRAMNTTTSATLPELFWDGEPQKISTYPNTGWLRVPANHDGNAQNFRTADNQVRNWSWDDEFWVNGFMKYEWADATERATANKSTNVVSLVAPNEYGIAANGRYRFQNVLEELDQPGEYYIDAKRGMVYFYPPADKIGKRVTVSISSDPLVKAYLTKYVRFEGIKLINGQRSAFDMADVQNIAIIGCTVSNMGVNGIAIARGKSCTIDSNNIENVGEMGIRVSGGDRLTLVSGDNVITNNEITNYSRINRAHRPGIWVHGVGTEISYNRIHDASSMAVLINGNNHTIENNEIARIGKDMDDVSAIGIGRNPTFQGNIVRNNLIQDLVSTVTDAQTGRPKGLVVGMYMDDGASGVQVYGNIFRRCAIGVLIGGGRDNAVRNNVFWDNQVDLHMDARMVADPNLLNDWNLTGMLSEVNYNQAPYSTAYPNLANLMSDDPTYPKRNTFRNNVSNNLTNAFWWRHNVDTLASPGGAAAIGVTSNYIGNNPGFVNPAADDFRPLPGSNAESVGFTGVNGSDIGLKVTAGRDAVSPLWGTARRINY